MIKPPFLWNGAKTRMLKYLMPFIEQSDVKLTYMFEPYQKSWLDGLVHPQFRTYYSPRPFQISLTNESFQGDWLFHFSVHVNHKALAFECPGFIKKEFSWRLYPRY